MPYLAILCVALLGFIAWRERNYQRHVLELHQAWRVERTGLLTRIQHPQIIDPRVVAEDMAEEIVADEEYLTAELDDIDLIGTVQMNGSDEDA